MTDVIIQLGLLIIVGASLAMLGRFIKQPPIVAYVLTGLLVGYLGSSMDGSMGLISVASEIGILFLLFITGLEIKFEKVKKVLKPTLVIGLSQIIFMLGMFFLLAFFAFKHNAITSLYIAIAFTLSSTIVVVKTLTNRKEIASLHGNILIGIMVIQDVFAMIALTLFTGLGGEGSFFLNIGILALKAIIVFIVLNLAGRFLVPYVFRHAAQSIELIFLTGLAWCFVGVNFAHQIGFSVEIGAFIAGMAIANLDFAYEIQDKARSIRDFGLLLFFTYIGSQMVLDKNVLLSMETLSYLLLVVFGTIFIVGFVASLFGFEKKHSFLLSIIPNQASEFSLVLLAMGLKLGHINSEILSRNTTIVVITIILSSFILANLSWITKHLGKYLDIYAWRKAPLEGILETKPQGHIIILGVGQLGITIAKYFIKKKKSVMVVEWEPYKVEQAKKLGCEVVYGDAGDPDIWDELYAQNAKAIISTIENNQDDDLHILKWVKDKNPKVVMVSETNDPKDAETLKNRGYDFVILQDVAEWDYLEKYFKKKKL